MKKLLSLFVVLSFFMLTACSETPEEEIGKVFQDGAPRTVELTNLNDKAMAFDQTALPEKGEQIVVMETSMGTIKIKLF